MKTIEAVKLNIKTERIDLPITGMTCAACANRIQKQLNKSVGLPFRPLNRSLGLPLSILFRF